MDAQRSTEIIAGKQRKGQSRIVGVVAMRFASDTGRLLISYPPFPFLFLRRFLFFLKINEYSRLDREQSIDNNS
jgi:hypothetical protein